MPSFGICRYEYTFDEIILRITYSTYYLLSPTYLLESGEQRHRKDRFPPKLLKFRTYIVDFILKLYESC